MTDNNLQCLNCSCDGDNTGSCKRFYQSVSNDVAEMVDNPPFGNQDTAKERKATPVFSGVLNTFLTHLKKYLSVHKQVTTNTTRNTPLHWDMEKSKDELDALTRHLIDHSS